MKYFFGIALFIISLSAGYGVFVYTFDHEQQKRTMASLKNNYDLSCLSGEEFIQAVKKRIISGIKITRKDGYLGLHLGHFTFTDPSADKSTACGPKKDRTISSSLQAVAKKLACKQYPKMSLHFSADQEASSGAKREMLVEADCQVSSDLSHTEVVWIPWDQLAHETPFEGDTQYNSPSKVSIRTKHIEDQWPSKWVLDRIELKGDAGLINVTAEEIRTLAGRPMVFEFR